MPQINRLVSILSSYKILIAFVFFGKIRIGRYIYKNFISHKVRVRLSIRFKVEQEMSIKIS